MAMAVKDDRQAGTDVAQSKGYDFSVDALWTEVQKHQREIVSRHSIYLTSIFGST